MKNLIKKLFQFIVSIPKDKLLHFIACYLISHVIISLLFLIFHPFYGGCIIGFCIGLAVTIAKEIYDINHDGHSFEFKDILYGTLGSLICSLLMFISTL